MAHDAAATTVRCERSGGGGEGDGGEGGVGGAAAQQQQEDVDDDVLVGGVVAVRRSADSGRSYYTILSVRGDGDGDGDGAFRLCRQRTARPPAGLAVMGPVPEYLRGGAARRVHVVVSTRSGTGSGRALALYDSVLAPLLTELGFSRADGEGAGGRAAGAQAGRGSLDEDEDEDEERLPYHLTVSRDGNSIRSLAERIGEENVSAGTEHTVILLSGDGGVVETLNGVAAAAAAAASASALGTAPQRRARAPLVVILPLGTGNALFHSLTKTVYASLGGGGGDGDGGWPEPSPLVLGLRTLFDGRPAALPTFKAVFSAGARSVTGSAVCQLHGAVVASYGLHSQLVWESDTAEHRRLGARRFGVVAEQLLRESHAYAATVELVPAEDEGGGSVAASRRLAATRHAYVLATMVSNLERTFTISPASRPLDGKLRLVHFGAVGSQKTREIMAEAYKDGRHVHMTWATDQHDGGDGTTEGRVGYDDIRQLKVTTWEEEDRWRKVCIDGAVVELARGGHVTISIEHVPLLRVLVHRHVRGDHDG